MRLWVAIREGDWAATRHGLFGACVAWQMIRLAEDGDWESAARWRALDTEVFPLVVDAAPGTRIDDLLASTLAAAQRRGLVRPTVDVLTFTAGNGETVSREDRIERVWLADPVTDARLDASSTVERAGLADLDAVVLCVERTGHLLYDLAPATNPERLFATLQLAEAVRRPEATPRLWGVLLYTDADAELATYVRARAAQVRAGLGQHPPRRARRRSRGAGVLGVAGWEMAKPLVDEAFRQDRLVCPGA